MARVTRQKRHIEQTIANFRFLFDAETLHSEVSKSDKRTGIATIYRFLKNMVAEGKLHAYQCNRQTIYSASTVSHCHFTCENCKEVRHIQLKKLDFLQSEIKGGICHFQIDVTGICEKCKKETK
ncbi:transcriptional repressor [Candidatus Woesearchaeota archaeon]|nr:transcriptional repressor [Candidatus Woesearchaeota archaeon]